VEEYVARLLNTVEEYSTTLLRNVACERKAVTAEMRLKFFEPRDSKLGDRDANVRPQPLWGHDGVPHYEISRICNARCHKGVDELWVEWKGYNQSQNGWVARSSLLHDVPHLVHAFEANPSVFITRKIAPKRASMAVRDVTLPPPPPALPSDLLNPRPVKSAVVLEEKKYNRYRVDPPGHFALRG